MSEAPKPQPVRSEFVVDGCLRAQSTAEPAIRAQVVAEYSDQLEGAAPWERFWLRRTIDREVRLRMDKSAPPDALY